MSDAKKNVAEEIIIQDNHAPLPPQIGEPAPQDNHAPAPQANADLVILDNHAPVPPALDRDGK